jgi:uncharacterized protein YkwD
MRSALLLAFFLAAACCARGSEDSLSQLEVEKRTFALINQYRDHDGLAPLKWDDDIAKIARGHSRDMADGKVDFGHDGFGDRVDRLKALVAGFRGAGENVLYTTELDDVASRAVQLWLHSPHHLRNIRGDYNLSGIGVWPSKTGALYFTQLFLKVAEPGN